MKLCALCRAFLATRFYAAQPVCSRCFLAVDARLLEPKADARAEAERETLEYWWNLGEARVTHGRG